MPNKKINQLDSRVLSATDLVLIGDPTTGTSYKSLVSGLGLVYVPYTGASSNVNLGEYELKAGQLTLDTSPTGTAAVGTTRWNDTIGSSETTLKGGSVILKNGVDLVARVVNKVSPNTTLTKAAYQAVKVSGAQGQRLAIALAQANNDANSADTIGLVTETIAANQEGFIITVGQIEGINTTGSLQGETWADGDVLYLSPTTAGRLTNIKPNGSTGHIVVIGYVEYAHANNGKIYVKIMNGWELDELHNVYISSVANNDALIYESSTSLWKNKTIATALGYTPVPTTRTLTINGTAYDLSADRSWTVSGSATPAGSNTQIQYNNSGVFGASAGLTYTDSTGVMTLSKNQNAATTLLIKNTTLGTAANSIITFENNAGASAASIFKGSTNITPFKNLTSGSLGIYNANYGTSDIAFLNDCTTGKITFITGAALTAQMTLTSAGRLLLGTVSESTYLLDVNGTARVSGDALVEKNQNAATQLTIKNTTSGTSAQSALIFNASGGTSYITKYSATKSAYKITNPNDFLISCDDPGDIAITADSTSGKIKFASGGVSTAQMTLTNAGRLLLGTTSEGTYLLDINGTSRYQGLATFVSDALITRTTSSDTTLTINSFSGKNSFVRFTNNTTNISGGIIATHSSMAYGTYLGNQLNITGGSGGICLRTNNAANITFNATNSDGDLSPIQLQMFASSGNVAFQNSGTFTDIPSARVQINSTTQGFLPPRMTTTQKNAIGTPAAGLVVYDTDTNKLCCYNGTSWNDLF